jgi:uncharacterized protein
VDNPQAALIRRKGQEHEAQHLATLVEEGREIVPIELGDWAVAAGATEEAMRAGADVVYQAVFVSPDGLRGIADFVERQPNGLYEVADTKLAGSPKRYFLRLGVLRIRITVL